MVGGYAREEGRRRNTEENHGPFPWEQELHFVTAQSQPNITLNGVSLNPNTKPNDETLLVDVPHTRNVTSKNPVSGPVPATNGLNPPTLQLGPAGAPLPPPNVPQPAPAVSVQEVLEKVYSNINQPFEFKAKQELRVRGIDSQDQMQNVKKITANPISSLALQEEMLGKLKSHYR